MAQPTVLTFNEAKEFLTKADFQKLEEQIRNGDIIVDMYNPNITIRGQRVSLFEALELMGNL